MEEKFNKNLYRIFLILIKYVPFIIGLAYLTYVILGCLGITAIIISNLFFLSPITAIVWLFASFVFKCCIWHRLPIYYCVLLQAITTIDYYFLGLSGSLLLFICLIITIFFILLGMFLKNKANVRKRSKERTS